MKLRPNVKVAPEETGWAVGVHMHDKDGNDIGYICGQTEQQTPWKRTDELFYYIRATHKVYVGCCNRNAPAKETEARFAVAYGGYVAGWHFRCAPDAGCNVNPGYKRTAHLRYYEFDE